MNHPIIDTVLFGHPLELLPSTISRYK